MAGQALKVLHVEDDFADAMLVQHAVCEAGDFDIAFPASSMISSCSISVYPTASIPSTPWKQHRAVSARRRCWFCPAQ